MFFFFFFFCKSKFHVDLLPKRTSTPFHSNPSQKSSVVCNLSIQSNSALETEPAPIFNSVKTVANLGPGYYFFGYAVDGVGHHVTLRFDSGTRAGQITISDIDGVGDSGKRLSKDPLWNCAGIAAIAVMNKLRIISVGLSLWLHKGLPCWVLQVFFIHEKESNKGSI